MKKALRTLLLSAGLAFPLAAQSNSKIVTNAVAAGQTGAIQSGADTSSVSVTFCGTGYSGVLYVDAASTAAALAQAWTTTLSTNSDCTTIYTEIPASKWHRVRWTLTAGTLNVWMAMTRGGTTASYPSLAPPASATLGCVGVFLGSPLNLQCDTGINFDAATNALTITGAMTAASFNITPPPGTHNLNLGGGAGGGALQAGSANVVFGGWAAANQATTPISVLALGTEAARNLTTGGAIVALGPTALTALQTGSGDVGVGQGAGNWFLGSYGTFVGTETAFFLETGDYDAAFGSHAGQWWNTNSNSVAVGHAALYGKDLGVYPSTGSGTGNTGVGFQVGYVSGATPSAANTLWSGSYNTLVGANAGFNSATQRDNTTVIGAGAYADASNVAVIGNAAVTDIIAGSTCAAYYDAARLRAYGLGMPGATNTEFLDVFWDGAQYVIKPIQSGGGSYRPLSIQVKDGVTLSLDPSGNGSATLTTLFNGGLWAYPSATAGSQFGRSNVPWETLYTQRTLGSSSTAITDGGSSPVATFTIADGASHAGKINYWVKAVKGTALQSLYGECGFTATREGSTYTATAWTTQQTASQVLAAAAGTLTGAVTIACTAGVCTLTATFDTSQSSPDSFVFKGRVDSPDEGLAVTWVP